MRRTGVPAALLSTASLALAFDLDKAIEYGSGKKPIPTVADSIECAIVTLSSPALRVAELVRDARSKGREPDRGEIEAAARPVLVASYAYRKPEALAGTAFNPRKLACTSSAAPERMLVTTKSRNRTLTPVGALDTEEQQWEGAQGAKWTSHSARASFDLDEVMKLAAAGEVRIVVGFARDESVFTFGPKELKNLEPEWAR